MLFMYAHISILLIKPAPPFPPHQLPMDLAQLLSPRLSTSAPSPSPSQPRLSPFSHRSRQTFPLQPSSNRRRGFFLGCRAEALLAGSQREKGSSHLSDNLDLTSWLFLNGLPPCKVELKEKDCKEGKHRSTRYVVAKEELQVCKSATFLFFTYCVLFEL
jgi:hypothetical protein